MNEDNESERRGRPRKRDEELSVRSQRRRIADEIASLRAPSPPLPILDPPIEERVSSPQNVSDTVFDYCSETQLFNIEYSADDTVQSEEGLAVQTNDVLGPGDPEPAVDLSVLEETSLTVFSDNSCSNRNETVEYTDSQSSSNQVLRFDCNVCLYCRCVICDVCNHSDSGHCIHCDGCLFEFDSEGSELNFEDEESDDRSDNLEGEILSGDDHRNLSMNRDLANIFLQRRASHALVNDILGFLAKYNIGKFPKSAKTFLKTPTGALNLRDVLPGQYWHCGITEHIISFIDKSNISKADVTLSCDGVPLFNSSAKSFWPLTCSLNDSPEVFIIGVYVGNEKPNDANDYLRDFVEEVTPLCLNGITVNGRLVQVNVRCVVCDAPAKSFLLCTKGHNAYFSCSKCTIEGEMMNRRMCFPECDCPLRSDQSFVDHTQEEYHKGRSILETIPRFGCVSCVPLDYMHLLLLGLMRKLMYMWVEGPLPTRLPAAKVKTISDSMISLVGWVPDDFARKTRSLQYLKRFKATEFRMILFYIGILIFYKVLPQALYEHFLVFHVVTSIYVDPVFCKKYLSFGKDLSVYFVKTFAEIYGQEYISHNVHCFIHLGDDVERFGPLDTFSAFKFENFYQILINLMRKGEKPLHQLVNRYSELKACGYFTGKSLNNNLPMNPEPFKLDRLHCNGPMLNGCKNPQYRSCTIQGGSVIKASQANRCCMLSDKSIVLVENFATDHQGKSVLIGRTFQKCEDLYNFPCKSSSLGICYVYNLSERQMWSTSLIVKKCFHYPWKSGFAVLPLHHN